MYIDIGERKTGKQYGSCLIIAGPQIAKNIHVFALWPIYENLLYMFYLVVPVSKWDEISLTLCYIWFDMVPRTSKLVFHSNIYRFMATGNTWVLLIVCYFIMYVLCQMKLIVSGHLIFKHRCDHANIFAGGKAAFVLFIRGTKFGLLYLL